MLSGAAADEDERLALGELREVAEASVRASRGFRVAPGVLRRVGCRQAGVGGRRAHTATLRSDVTSSVADLRGRSSESGRESGSNGKTANDPIR